MSGSKCIVPRSMGLILRISRVFGIAPVRVKNTGDGCIVRYEPRFCVYGYTVIGALCLVSVCIGIIPSMPSEDTSFKHMVTTQVVKIVNFTLQSILCAVGAHQVSARMKSLIEHVTRVQKVTTELKDWIPDDDKYTDTLQYRYVFVIMFSYFVIMFAEVFVHSALAENNLFLFCGTVTYNVGYTVTALLEIQFIMIALYVFSAFKLINRKLIQIQNKYRCDFLTAQDGLTEDSFGSVKGDYVWSNVSSVNTIKLPPKLINNIIDTFGFVKSFAKDINFMKATSKDGTSKESVTHVQTIDQLSDSYMALCELVKEITQNFGIVLFLLLSSFFVRLLVSLYYMIVNIYSDDRLNSNRNYIVRLILQALWCVLHFTGLVLMVEPCHRTHFEMQTTKHLVCSISLINERLAIETKTFSKYFHFNKVTYSPLQICTINRPLVITIMRNIITYLVIVLQLEIEDGVDT